ncbi:MAG: hypothetical protein WA058_01100 [Minisyncoccia bacterium]
MTLRSLCHSFFNALFTPNPEKGTPSEWYYEVQKWAERRVNERFLTDSNDQAFWTVFLMISHVREEDTVLIYSRALEHHFFLQALCQSKCHIDIILDDVRGVEVIAALPQSFLSRIEWRISSSACGRHFLVAGDSFRYDGDDQSDELYAICNFNEPETVQKLRARFKDIWGNALLTLEAA